MDIVILTKSDKPIYEQIYGQLAALVLSGELPAGFCLPSIRNIARETGVSVITVKKAYEMLEAAGLIYTRAGIGCFVSPHKDAALEDKKFELAKERLKKDLVFYKELGLTTEELLELIRKNYGSAE